MKIFFERKVITRRDDGSVYMLRRALNIFPWVSFKIHKIILSDYECLHDHPWNFISIILCGGYVEHTEKGSKIIHPWSILYRPANWKHRLEIHQTAWTFVITFRKIRRWGFWTSKGWVHWKQYDSKSSCE